MTLRFIGYNTLWQSRKTLGTCQSLESFWKSTRYTNHTTQPIRQTSSERAQQLLFCIPKEGKFNSSEEPWGQPFKGKKPTRHSSAAAWAQATSPNCKRTATVQPHAILRAIKTHMWAKERVPGNRKHQVSASRLSSLSDHRTFRGCGKVNSHRCAVYTHVLCIIGKVYAHTNKFYKRRYGQIVSRKNNLFPLHSLVTLKMLLLIQLWLTRNRTEDMLNQLTVNNQ